MMNLEKLQKEYADVVDATNLELKELVKQYERLVIPENTGALLADYLNKADQFRIGSDLPYADKVENQMDEFRKPGAIPQAAQATREYADAIAPRLMEFNLRTRGLIA